MKAWRDDKEEMPRDYIILDISPHDFVEIRELLISQGCQQRHSGEFMERYWRRRATATFCDSCRTCILDRPFFRYVPELTDAQRQALKPEDFPLKTSLYRTFAYCDICHSAKELFV